MSAEAEQHKTQLFPVADGLMEGEVPADVEEVLKLVGLEV